MIYARKIDVEQQAVLQLSSFSFFVIGWMHEPLHSFDGGAFQSLIWITAQFLQELQGECIVRFSGQFLDQLSLARP